MAKRARKIRFIPKPITEWLTLSTRRKPDGVLFALYDSELNRLYDSGGNALYVRK